jgi:hypothetical protein
MLIWFPIHSRFARLSRRKIKQFQDLTDELYWAEAYSELFALLQQHCKQLFKIVSGDFALARLRERLMPDPTLRIRDFSLKDEIDASAAAESFIEERESLRSRALRSLARLLPTYSYEQDLARDVIRTLFLSERIVGPLATTRPYFALDIIRAWPRTEHGRFEFVELYCRELLRDPTSILYAELNNNRNVGANNRYYIPESNHFLHFFLAEARVAYEYEIYRPLGDYVLFLLDELARDPARDPNCRAMDKEFEERGRWHSPLFATIRFFNIMVIEALFQGVEWHMWLYYFPLLVKAIARNYKLDDVLIEPTAGWKTRYSYLMYQAFDAMGDWIRGAMDIDPAQANVTLHSLRADHDNGNIPKSAILALCQSLREVFEAASIEGDLKASIADMAFRLYFELRASPKMEGYATVLRRALWQGGTYRRPDSEIYQSALIRAFESQRTEYQIKFGYCENVDELERAITADSYPS